jgi:ABC-type nickel/cobalt efflux system permease component RcnA
MELGLLLIFWYGILHAFGPDHLAAITNFSIGKSKRKTMLITFLFAIGHGLTLFLFAKILQTYNISETLLGYGDVISSCVILGMGIYLLYMVYSDKIHLNTHNHDGQEHVHIWFGKEHNHDNKDTASAFTIGVLMGIGGVRGMLVTLGAVEAGEVNLLFVLMFALGVMVIFIGFGAVILYINKNILNSKKNVRNVFSTVGLVSVVVGTNMLLG